MCKRKTNKISSFNVAEWKNCGKGKVRKSWTVEGKTKHVCINTFDNFRHVAECGNK